MNDRLEIAKDVLAGIITRNGEARFDLGRSDDALTALAYADELIKQEALTRVKKEAEEHK